jgi:hypothetical protein
MVGEVYGVAEYTISQIVREFYKMVILHIQKIFIQIPKEIRFRVVAKEVERLYNILYIIEVIEVLHIHVLAPIIGGEDYYCRKSFHSALLQGIVDTNCIFWDYELGGHETCMIGLFFNKPRLEALVWKENSHHTTDWRCGISGATLDVLSIQRQL